MFSGVGNVWGRGIDTGVGWECLAGRPSVKQGENSIDQLLMNGVPDEIGRGLQV
jgi:hypothetical protein